MFVENTTFTTRPGTKHTQTKTQTENNAICSNADDEVNNDGMDECSSNNDNDADHDSILVISSELVQCTASKQQAALQTIRLLLWAQPTKMKKVKTGPIMAQNNLASLVNSSHTAPWAKPLYRIFTVP